MKDYKLENYIEDIETRGLEDSWNDICDYVISNGENEEFLRIDNFGEMYEIGLAIIDKQSKRKSGQYYTPDDIAKVLAYWFNEAEGVNICDVACGTGKLILTYLDLIGKEEAVKVISEGRIYLYDFDKVAIKICKTAIMVKYGVTFERKIHDICGDFLDKTVKLPENSKVISNPPYAGMSEFGKNWEITEVIKDSREYYSAFMEKVFSEAISTVIITPFTFISGSKYRSLRSKMCKLGHGHVVSFDNIPGNIFCGRKHGVFNTNTSNSVRAAVTVLKKSENNKGFRISPLIRFKNEERDRLLIPEVLESMLPEQIQIVDEKNDTFKKIEESLLEVYESWVEKSEYTVKDFLTKEDTGNLIDMPNTCRYYTTASHRKLKRGGSITFNVEDSDMYNFLYCMINSSFTYWWWRIFDGGITYPASLFYKMPLPYNLLSDSDKEFFAEVSKEMMENESKYIITKMNAKALQENIKFPEEYKNKINDRILTILGFKPQEGIFDRVCANSFFEGEKKVDKNSVSNSKKEIINEFYSHGKTKVIFNKKERDGFWKSAVSRDLNMDFKTLSKKCPALLYQIEKSYETGKNIQSAVFSECVYAKTLADMLGLTVFINCDENYGFIPEMIEKLLESHGLIPRFVYSDSKKSSILIQAGGCNGIDCALINTKDLSINTIEFKEPESKTSEPDLPKYGEDGILTVTEEFLEKYPHFEEMLKEQKGLNFFEAMGSNINDFSMASISIAVTNNYTKGSLKKNADVICTEDKEGNLVMVPAQEVGKWAKIEGEIRPAGRNYYKAWTPLRLKDYLKNMGARFLNNDTVKIEKSKLTPRIERGGNGRISGYKINPLFFVKTSDCLEKGKKLIFPLDKVYQLNPTVAGKMYFRNLKYLEVKEHYLK